MSRYAKVVAMAILLAACSGDNAVVTIASTTTAVQATTTVSTPLSTTTTPPTTSVVTTTPTSTTTAPSTSTASTTTTTVAPTTTSTASTTTTTSLEYVALGGELATSLGCRNCHSIDGSVGLGPSWKGLGGSTVTLNNGSTTTATNAYIEESIRSPDAKIVNGFLAGVMQSDYAGLSTEDMAALVAHIASR